MAVSRTETLTYHFYDWEKRGRGWHLFEAPVGLEPPFKPFYHYIPTDTAFVDDGKAPSIFAAPFHAIAKLLSFSKNSNGQLPEEEAIQAHPSPSENVTLQSFAISFPKESKIQAQPMEQLLTVLSTCANPLSFEIIATSATIHIQIVCRAPDVLFIKSQVKAYFPECTLEENSESLLEIADERASVSVIDLGLREEFMRPIAMCERLDLDPLTGIFGMLEHLQGKDKAAIQILFQGASYPWAQSIISSVSDNRGECFFEDAPEMLDLAREKVSSPLYAVVIRAIGESTTRARATSISEGLARMLQQVSQSESNMLCPLDDYHEEVHLYDVLLRKSHRLGMILNARELLTFAHFPSPSVVSSKLARDSKKTKAAPAIAKGHSFVLGSNLHQGWNTPVTVSAEQRLKHTHIIGATGTGKSTLLLNLIVQDIQQGNGIAVLDPHGDLIESILAHIPDKRISDVVLVDPSDALFPIGFNILSANSDIEKDVLSSDLVAVFRRLSTSWGDQMNSVFANAILAFLENSKSGTLMDLRRFLVEKDFRETHLKTVTDPSIVYYWKKEYPIVKSASIGPILTRLDTFLRPKLIRNMVAQKRSLDFENILNTGKILLVKLSQGLIGDENSYLLGTVFVSKIYQAAMARQAKGKEERNDFFLYVDEFQNFITPSMSQVLAGARKYHLGLTLAHQDMQQLMKEDATLASAVIANAGTRICFRIGDTDAKRFEDGFSFFDAKDLQNLETGEAIVRIDRPEYDFNLSITPFQKDTTNDGTTIQQRVIAQSREKYGTLRATVEASFEYFQKVEEPVEKEQSKDEPIQEVKEYLKEEIKTLKTEKHQPVVEVPNQEKIQKTTENFIKQKELSQHRYLQTLIKKMAEARGYKALIEEPTPDGKGRVDVSLERSGKRIACEIGVTTTKEWEVHNIEKCLSAGYEVVIAVASDAKAKEAMQKQVSQQLNDRQTERVFVMEADSLFHYLDTENAKEATSEKRMKGYRIKIQYETPTEKEMKNKKASITKIVLDSIKKEKK